ncbi:MAG: triose-phosphate isomerase [Elusimicrobia bacterium RIFOXYA2_FULL_69_6]|nr:MAG: triose-phosphate isomerase [Elusimicrobia bacterium RIFOXYA2_FULL_69_6]
MTASVRRPFIAGNWKMHLTLAQSVELAKAVRDGTKSSPAEVAVCVPFTALTVVAEVLKGSHVKLGGQDLYWETQGAFTGEVSAGQLGDAGATHVIIGHSERRRLFADSDEWVNKKLRAALAAKLIPIVCVGETLDERQSNKTFRVLETQMEGALKGFAPADISSVVVAYEPVWAIGTGVTATPAQAQEAHLFLRKQAAKLYGEGFAAGLRILYGGSVTAENVDNLMAQPDLDGALVGGASLKAPSFARIANFQVPAKA